MDLHIVGSGPAGTISAMSAIRNHNANVIVSEEHQVAGVPTHCSGLFSIDGLESLKEFINYKKLVVNRMNGAIIDLAGEKIHIKAGKDIACVCSRADFDATLAENAKREGAKIEYGKRISLESELRGKNIIGADGPNSFIAKHFCFPKIKKFAATLQANINYEAPDKNSVEVFLSNEKFPGFFGWIIPHNEEIAEFGCGVTLPNNPRKAFESLLAIKNLKTKVDPTGAIIPIRTRPKTAMQKNGKTVLLVGDAAGQVKATTGGGVIFGGNCARVAGKYFNQPLRYEISWKRRFGIDLFLHSSVQSYLEKKNDNQLRQIGKKLREAGIEEYLSKKGHMDKPSKMVSLDMLKLFIGL